LSHVYIEQSARGRKGFASEHVAYGGLCVRFPKPLVRVAETLGNIPSLASGH